MLRVWFLFGTPWAEAWAFCNASRSRGRDELSYASVTLQAPENLFQTLQFYVVWP